MQAQRFLPFYMIAASATLAASAAALAAPPPNDNCYNAEVLTTADYETVLNLSEATVESCEATAACETGSTRSVWYAYTPPANGLLSVIAHNANDGNVPVAAVFDGCATPFFGGCIQPSTVACGEAWSFFDVTVAQISELPVQAGLPLLIKVAMDAGSGPAVYLGIEFHASEPNDTCAHSTMITAGQYQDTVDLEGIAYDQYACDGSELGCNGVALRTAWYRFDAPADGSIALTTSGSTFDTMLTVYDGCPLPLLGDCVSNELACINDPSDHAASLGMQVTAGSTYVIRAAETGEMYDDLVLEFSFSFSPANDHCGEAINIAMNTFNPLPLPVGGADTTDQEPQEDCAASIVGMRQSVFYSFTPAADGFADLHTIGTNYDTVLSVYDGCGMLMLPGGWIQPAELACNNDVGGVLGAVSAISDLPVQAGQTYIIKVAHNGLGQDDDMLDFNFEFTPGSLCAADITPAGGNGTVNVDDLLAVIGAWGPCGNPYVCPADLAPGNGDGQVNVDDLLAVINAWGACP